MSYMFVVNFFSIYKYYIVIFIVFYYVNVFCIGGYGIFWKYFKDSD